MKKSLLILMTAIAAVNASAQTPYDEIVASVLRNNAGLKAELASEKAAVVAGQAENTLGGPSVGFEHMWSADPEKKDKWAVSVSQEFDFPGVYRARSQANEYSEQALDYASQNIMSGKALSAKLMILDVINAKARLDYYLELSLNLNHIGVLTQRSFDGGNATILDLRKIKIAILNNDRQVAACKGDLATLMASLKAMGAEISDSDEFWSEYPMQALNEPSSNPEDYLEYHISNLKSKASVASAKAIKLQAVPSIGLGYRHAFEDGTHFNGLSVSIALPSFSQSKRRKLAALEAEVVAAQGDDGVALAMAEQTGLYSSAVALKKSLNDYRKLCGDDSYLELLRKTFEGGELTIIDYINEINIYSQARLDFIDLEYQYNLTLARLNRYRALEFN